MWDVNLIFDGDETTKLCPNGHGQNGVFETHKVAHFFATQEVLSIPKVCCVSSSTCVVTSIDNFVSVLNEDCQNVVCKMNLDSHVDCMALSHDSEWLLVGENNGIAHLLHISSQTRIWSMPLEEQNDCEESTFIDVFFSSEDEEEMKVCLLSHDVLHIFYDINCLDLIKSIELGGSKEIINKIQKCQISIKDDFPQFRPHCAFQSNIDADFPIVLSGMGSGDTFKKQLDFTGITVFSPATPGISLKKAVSIRNGRYIIGLDSENVIRVICSETLLVVKRWAEEKVVDFVINERVVDPVSNTSECRINMKIRDENLEKIRFQICSFPSFRILTCVNLNDIAVLANCKTFQDTVYIVESASAMGTGCLNDSTTFLLNCFSEVSFENKLLSLLSKKKFARAEKIADVHKLDRQIIYKTKIKCLLDDLAHAQSDRCDVANVISELEDCLGKVHEAEFIKSCLSIHLRTSTDARKFYLLCQRWLENFPAIGQKDQIMAELNQIINRTYTWEILFETNFICIEWQHFLDIDLMSFFLQQMQHGNLHVAFILWQRHQEEFLNGFNEETLKNVLSSIPMLVHTDHLIPFLEENFFPPILHVSPDSVGTILNWLIERTHKLAITEKKNWPRVGCKFLEAIYNVLNKKSCSFLNFIPLAVHIEREEQKHYFDEINELMKNLKDLIALEENYDCQLSISEYSQENKQEVLFMILDRILVENITKAVTGFVKSFVSENGFSLEESLLDYVKAVLEKSPYTWWYREEAPWETRLTTILSCIHDRNLFMDGAIAIVFHAPIPWSVEIRNVMDVGLSFEHPKKNLLKAQVPFVSLKQVLMKYDLRDFPLNNDIVIAKQLINYVIKKDRDTSFEDAVQVCRVYEMSEDIVYMSYFYYLIDQDRLEELKKCMASLPGDVSSVYCERLLTFISLFFDPETMIQNVKSTERVLVQAGVFLGRYLQSMKYEVDSSLISSLKAAAKLQTEFDLFVPFKSLSSEDYCWSLVDSAIEMYMSGKSWDVQIEDKKKAIPTSSVTHVYRLADIVGLNRENVTVRLIHKFLERKQYENVVNFCRQLISMKPSATTANILKNVVDWFLKEFSDSCVLGSNNIVVEMLHHLTCITVAFCDEKTLGRYITILQHTHVMASMNKLIKPEILITCDNNNMFRRWMFSSLYYDEGLFIDSSKINLLFGKRYIENVLLEQADSNVDTDFVVNQKKICLEYSSYLIQRGQPSAALCFVNHILSFLVPAFSMQHSASAVENVVLDIVSAMEELVLNVVQCIINQRKADLTMALGFCNLLPKESMVKIHKRLLKWCSSNYIRILRLHLLAIEYFSVRGDIARASQFRKFFEKLFWFSKHSSVTYSAMELMKLTYQEEEKIIREIITTNEDIELENIMECGKFCNIVTDDILVICLNKILLGTKIKTWISLNEITQNQLDTVLNEAGKLIGNISNKEQLLKSLVEIMNNANQYYYEVLLFIHEEILKLMVHLNLDETAIYNKGVALLQFLVVYDRVSSPSEIEIEQWNWLNPTETNLPAIASKRLPFNVLMKSDMHKIINPELRIATADVWLTVAPIINLEPDDLRMIAVKNSVTSYLSQQRISSAKNVNLMPDMAFLVPLGNLIKTIENPVKLTGCSMWVTNNFPLGINKLLIAKESATLASQSSLSCPGDKQLENGAKYLSAVHQNLNIEILLCKYDMASEQCLALHKTPQKLIEYLLDNLHVPAKRFVKYCEVMQEIADISNLHLWDIYFTYICKWLAPAQPVSVNMDESFILPDSPVIHHSKTNADKGNILSAICLLRGLPHSMKEELLNVVFKTFSDCSVKDQARSLFCITSTVDLAAAAKISGHSEERLQDTVTELMCAAELESLHLPFSVETVRNCNKVELVQSILLKHCNNRKALLICAKICITYKIWNCEIWSCILQKLSDYDMGDELREILNATVGHLSHIWHKGFFKVSWSTVITNLFEKGNFGKEECLKDIKNLYDLLLRCPCSLTDVKSIWKRIEDIVPHELHTDPSLLQINVLITILHQWLFALKEEGAVKENELL